MTDHQTIHGRALDLPAVRTHLIGRDADLARLRRLLASSEARIVTLTGPGGVGKTRLALAIADDPGADFPGGAVVVPLAVVRDPGLVAGAIASALNTRDDLGQAPEEAIVRAIAERRVLLILDNMEHIQDAAPLVGTISQRCPNLTILATSRVPLRLTGEFEFPVAPLVLHNAPDGLRPDEAAGEPAVQLFVERAQAVRQGFAVTAENAPAIAEIVRRLDGLPLAIELAAARTKVMSPAAMLARLSGLSKLLTGGPRDAPERLQSMRAAISWSYDLLDDEQQRLFRALAVFTGGFSLEAGERVGGLAPGEGLDAIGALVDHSLVVTVDSGTDEPRFGLLETIRDFALEALDAAGERPLADQLHAALFAEYVLTNSAQFFTEHETAAIDRLDRERNDLRQAIAWLIQHEIDRAAEVVYAAWYFYGVRGYYREGLEWLQRIAPRIAELTPLARGRIEIAFGFLWWATGQYDDALRALDRADAELSPSANPRDVAVVAFARGSVHRDQGDCAPAREHLHRGLAMFERLGDRAWMAYCLSVLGAVARGEGRYDEALGYLERGLALCTSIPYPPGTTPIVDHLGDIARERGDFRAALDYYRQTLGIWLELRDPHGAADSLAGFAAALGLLGDRATAVRLLASAEAALRKLGLPPSRYGPPLHSDVLAELRTALGDRFAELWQEGAHEPIFAAMRWAIDYQPNHAVDAPPAEPLPWHEALGLTARERQILDLLCDGKANAEIADALYISTRTASTHVSNILAKLGVGSRAAAVAIALRAKGT